MTNNIANRTEIGDKAGRDIISRQNNAGSAKAPSENATDTSWFVPPIVVPVLLGVLVAVRVLALS